MGSTTEWIVPEQLPEIIRETKQKRMPGVEGTKNSVSRTKLKIATKNGTHSKSSSMNSPVVNK